MPTLFCHSDPPAGGEESLVNTRYRRQAARSLDFARDDKSGFSLIEILIAVAVLSIIAVVSIPNLGRSDDSQRVKNAYDEFVSTIKLAQSKAMSGVKCDGVDSKQWEFTVIDASRYKITCKDTSGASHDTIHMLDPLREDSTQPLCSPPFTITFKNNNVILPCSSSNSLTISLKDSTVAIYSVTIDKGGAIY